MDLYFDGTVAKREEPLVHVAHVQHARDPSKLHRYNINPPMKGRPKARRPESKSQGGLAVTGTKTRQQLRTREEMIAGQAAAEAADAAKKELNRKLEEMAVGACNAWHHHVAACYGTPVFSGSTCGMSHEPNLLPLFLQMICWQGGCR